MTDPLTTPGTAPNRNTQTKEVFDINMAARLAWQETNVSEMNVVIPIIDQAVAAAPAAIAAGGATKWVSGTAVTQQQVDDGYANWSPTDGQSYRLTAPKTSGENVTDPAADSSGDWTKLSVDVGLVNNYLSGLTLSNNGTDADHDIDVSVGLAADSTNAEYLELASAITKRIDATWASGTGNGGLSSSLTAPANNTWYHVFLVKIGGSVDVLFDTSVTCANGVTDHTVTEFRRIGSIKTDGSANIVAFHQKGDRFYWDSIPRDFNGAIASTSAQTFTLSVPNGIQVEAIAYCFSNTNSADRFILITDLDQTDTAASISNTTFWMQSSDETAVRVVVTASTSGQIRGRTSSATSFIFNIFTEGWYDRRGK